MASSVDISNLALAHLGDSATVASIDPPEGSAQAEHCARFYPLALASMLEMHTWAFCTRRTTLAQVANPSTTWLYAYARPAGCLNILSIIDPAASDDYSAVLGNTSYSNFNGATVPVSGVYTPQKFAVETAVSGEEIILTNQAGAVARYTAHVSDTAKFTPLFTEALTWLLASKLAGPVLKGSEGRSAAKDCLSTFNYWMTRAAGSDASNQLIAPEQQVAWVNAR
jgi:hypothetical protein